MYIFCVLFCFRFLSVVCGHCNAGWHLNSRAFLWLVRSDWNCTGKKKENPNFDFVGFLLNIWRIYLRRKRFLVFCCCCFVFSQPFLFYFWKTKKSRDPVLGDEGSNTLGIPVEYTRATTKKFFNRVEKDTKGQSEFQGGLMQKKKEKKRNKRTKCQTHSQVWTEINGRRELTS